MDSESPEADARRVSPAPPPGVTSAPPGRAVLQCDGVAVRFPRGSAWRPAGASWSAPAGSRTLVLGPSGCGKSTLALALAGLVPEVLPARIRGEVCIDGEVLGEMPSARLREAVSIVFQDPDAQLFTETVFDEVCFALENRLLPVDEIVRRAEHAIEAMRLREFRDANPRHLSGGERQRVAIACALAAAPKVLVLDEPTANLDPASRAALYRVLGALPASPQRSVVVIEHNVDDALEFVDRVVALDARGTVLVEGPVDEVFATHAAALTNAGVWLPIGLRVANAVAGSPLESLLAPTPILDAPALERTLERFGQTSAGARPDAVAGPGDADCMTAGDQLHPALAVEVRGLTVDRDRGRSSGRRRRGGDRGAVSGRRALDDVDLEVREGAFAAIVGVNGAGKSTLLHVIAGLLEPSEGEVRVRGIRVRKRGASPIGLVFQNPEHQFVEATVRDELRTAADPRLSQALLDARVAQLLARFGLEAEADRHPSMLSGGQQRRLSVGTALMGGHRVIAFDEPTFGQDAEGAAALAELLASLHEEGVTVLVVTHDLQLVADHATHVVVLRDGRVAASGTADEVLTSMAIEAAGLRLPPLLAAARELPPGHPLHRLRRLRDLERFARGDMAGLGT